jgi:hypothetical protein
LKNEKILDAVKTSNQASNSNLHAASGGIQNSVSFGGLNNGLKAFSPKNQSMAGAKQTSKMLPEIKNSRNQPVLNQYSSLLSNPIDQMITSPVAQASPFNVVSPQNPSPQVSFCFQNQMSGSTLKPV